MATGSRTAAAARWTSRPSTAPATTPSRGFTAIRFMGGLDYTLPTDLFALFVHFEPQSISCSATATRRHLLLPGALGTGFDLKVVHLEADVGVALFFSGTATSCPSTTRSSPRRSSASVPNIPQRQVAITLRCACRRSRGTARRRAPARSTPTLFGFGYVLVGPRTGSECSTRRSRPRADVDAPAGRAGAAPARRRRRRRLGSKSDADNRSATTRTTRNTGASSRARR